MTLHEIGQKVRVERKKKGWSQSELAERAGVRQSAVSRIEQGSRSAGKEAHSKVAGALEISYCLTIPAG